MSYIRPSNNELYNDYGIDLNTLTENEKQRLLAFDAQRQQWREETSTSGYKEGFTYKEIYKAFKDCLKNKATTTTATKFCFHIPSALRELLACINAFIYIIASSVTFVVTFPKLREVFAAAFIDRIVHHLVINELLPLFEEYFIEDTYSCRPEKGVIYGVKRVEKLMAEASNNYTKPAYILKLDIKSFFMSIDKLLLAEMLDEFIVEKYHNLRKKRILRYLCQLIILHHPEQLCTKKGNVELWKDLSPSKSLFGIKGECGLPIGNLTSQVFANFYLTPLDRFIKEMLGFKYYGRYVDDFVIICDDKQKLLDARQKIFDFTREVLGLEIHTDKVYFQEVKQGVKFIGTVIKPNRKHTLRRTVGMLRHKMETVHAHPTIENAEEVVAVINSYMGFMIHNNTYNIRKKLFTKYNILKNWEDWIEVLPNYDKVVLKPDKKELVSKQRGLDKELMETTGRYTQTERNRMASCRGRKFKPLSDVRLL